MSLTTEKVLDAKLHVWSLKKESSPKTGKYRQTVFNGVVVIDPDMIAERLENAKKRVQEARGDKKSILVICDKSMYVDELKALSAKENIHYLSEKVPPGFLTNFDTLMVRIKDLNKKLLFMDSEDFLKLTKKEQVSYKRSVKKVEKIYGWVKTLREKPDLVVVFDGSMMVSFLKEVKKEWVDNIVFCSTDFSQRWDEESVVVANMKSYKSIDFMMQYLFS